MPPAGDRLKTGMEGHRRRVLAYGGARGVEAGEGERQERTDAGYAESVGLGAVGGLKRMT